MRRRDLIIPLALALVLTTGPAPALADEPAPTDPPAETVPPSPVDVPPLVSEPLILPESTTPEGDFTNCCYYGPDPAPSPEAFVPMTPPPPAWTTWTPQQIAALTGLVSRGGAVSIVTGPDGSLLVQDITGYGVDNAPTPWSTLDVNGTTTLLTPVSSAPGSPAPSANSLAPMTVPSNSAVSLVATNTSAVAAMILVTWQSDYSRTNRWHRLEPGEVWNAGLEAPPGTSAASLSVLTTQAMSLRGFEIGQVTVIATATATG